MVYIQGPLSGDIPVNIDLNDMRSGAGEAYICKEGNVIRIAVVFDGKFRRHRDDDLFAIGRQDLHVRLELPVADPMVHDRELQQCRRESLKEDVLEQSHQGKLVSHLEADIVTDDGIDELGSLFGLHRRSRSKSLA